MADLFVRAASGDSAVGASTIVFAANGSGCDLITVFPCFNKGASPDSVSTVTYASSSLTFKDFSSSASIRIEGWFKTGTFTGTTNVVVTFSAALNHSCTAGAQLFTGTNQSTPLGTAQKNASSAGNSTITLTSIGAANSGCDAAASGNSVTVPTQTTSWIDNNQSIGGGGSHAAGNASRTFQWTIGGEWAAIAFEVQASTAAGGAVARYTVPTPLTGIGVGNRLFGDRLTYGILDEAF